MITKDKQATTTATNFIFNSKVNPNRESKKNPLKIIILASNECFNIMPSKQTNDVLAMEELVHEIKENLRLKANPTRTSRSSRPSPYHIPCRSWSGEPSTTTCDHTTKSNKTNSSNTVHSNKNKDDSIDDPYELLQALLKSNNLVKEAVRRLQLNNISPKQRYFYESDEESRSPMIRVCQLEL